MQRRLKLGSALLLLNAAVTHAEGLAETVDHTAVTAVDAITNALPAQSELKSRLKKNDSFFTKIQIDLCPQTDLLGQHSATDHFKSLRGFLAARKEWGAHTGGFVANINTWKKVGAGVYGSSLSEDKTTAYTLSLLAQFQENGRQLSLGGSIRAQRIAFSLNAYTPECSGFTCASKKEGATAYIDHRVTLHMPCYEALRCFIKNVTCCNGRTSFTTQSWFGLEWSPIPMVNLTATWENVKAMPQLRLNATFRFDRSLKAQLNPRKAAELFSVSNIRLHAPKREHWFHDVEGDHSDDSHSDHGSSGPDTMRN